MHKPSSTRDYVIALLIATSLTVFFGLYLFIRRGYLFDAPPTADTLYVPNKAIVGAGTILLAFTFLIGPIVRYFDRFDKWLGYRKEIGIVGGFLVFSHAIISYFFLPLKFPQSKLDLDSLTFGAGLLGTLLLIFLFIISFKKVTEMMDGSRWWFLQRWGLRLVILFTLIHVYSMKWAGWIKWLKQGGTSTIELSNPSMAGLGILVMMFVTWVVIVRLYESIFVFRNFGLATKEITLDIALKTRGRNFFIRSFWVLVVLYFFIITRWMC
jgi:DMSO/TMAO reductase YedYZ heme-binding membrane subunit